MLLGSVLRARKVGRRHNDVAGAQLRALCDALGLQAHYPEYLLLQRFLFGAWGDRLRKPSPPYPSLIGDDHSPYEYSVAFTKGDVELRLLLEAQALRPSLAANHRAAAELSARIAEVFPISLTRFDSISDLFLPEDVRGPFSLWHAVSLRRGRKPKFKVYLNPQARGREQAWDLVCQALSRLGLASAARVLTQEVAHRGPQRDEVNYFSLDLSDEPSARVKVYFCHHHASASNLERSFAASPFHRPGDVTAFCTDMVGHNGPFRHKPVTSCFAFNEGSDRPRTATCHLPIAHYAPDDQTIAKRITQFMQRHDIGVENYADLLSRFASRPLASGVGLQSYASYRRDAAGSMLLTVYLSPELFRNALEVTSAPQAAVGHLLPESLAAAPSLSLART